MVFLSSLPEKYVGKRFEIDCVDIEIHGFEDNQTPIFKGPGIIEGDIAGLLTYKIYNQIPVNKEIFDYLKRIREDDDPKKTNIRFFAKSYDGIEWNGGWSIPSVNLFQAPYLLVHGEFDQLATRVKKIKGDQTLNSTEVIFADQLNLPFAGTVKVKSFHGDKLISTKTWGDHHELSFGDSFVLLQQSSDKTRTHATVSHSENFSPPFIENWIAEALTFISARVIQPRMVIRHFEKDALVFIRATPKNIISGMPPPFSTARETREFYWEAFCAYLSKCKSMAQFEPLEITTGFCELCLASKGTLQGFLISLSIFIEFCVNQLCSSLNIEDAEEEEYRNKVDGLIQHVEAWDKDKSIIARAKGLLSMLKTPSLSKRLDALFELDIITKNQIKIWKKARPYLAHGNLIDFRKEEEFWQFRNHLISMAYRLILRIIGYKGIVLDYDGIEFRHIPYIWKDECPTTPCT